MEWVCEKAPKLGGWVVEAIGDDGEVFVAQFYGPGDEFRAREYANWKGASKTQPPSQPL